MTAEEAIERINEHIAIHRYNEPQAIRIAEALQMAIEALEKQIQKKAQKDLQPTCNNLATDCISRQALCEYALSQKDKSVTPNDIMRFPSAQPELTDDRAIEHLQSTGWMQNHDKEMYEMGLKEQLADDSGSYDSLIPCEDAISRRAAIDAIKTSRYLVDAMEKIIRLPSAQPNLQPTCNNLATDTISRQAAIDAIANCTNCGDEKTLRAYVQKHNLDNGWTGGVLEAIDAIEDLPSAQSDIIRCNACKHWTQTTGNMPGFGLGDCDYLNAKLVSCNGFCYWAERRTDGN